MDQQHGARILVVDGDPGMLCATRTALAEHGFQVETADSGGEALELFRSYRADVIVLDLHLPDMDGLEVLRTVRDQNDTQVVVSENLAEDEEIAALALGADDCLAKLSHTEILVAHLRAALRHTAHPASGAGAVLRVSDLEVDIGQRRVRVAGEEVRLTSTEYALLEAFVRAPDQLLTSQTLRRQIWGTGYESDTHCVREYVKRLRRKLGEDPGNPRVIVSVPGGYRLQTK